MNRRSQETDPSNEPVKATEIPQFSGVISADFFQRITRDHIKPPRALLFSHYILSRIQRRLIPGIADVSVTHITPCTLTLAVGQRVSSEGVIAPKDNYVNALPSTSLLQPSLLRMPIENELRRSERIAAEGGLSTGQDEQRSGFNLLFSEAPSSILSVKLQQEGMISRDSLMTDFSLASPKGEPKPYDERISEPSQIEASEEFSPTLQRISIPRKPVFSAPVSINDASFADTVAEKSAPDAYRVSAEISSQIRRLELTPLSAFQLTGSELTHVQQQTGRPAYTKTGETGVRFGGVSAFSTSLELSQMGVSGTPPSNIGIISSAPVSINYTSFADTVAERSVPEISTVGSDIPSRTGQLDFTTLRAVRPAGSELTHVQRRVELPDASLKARETGIQPEERSAIGILSEWPQTNVSEALTLSMPGVASSGSMSIIDTSFADMTPGSSKPKTSTVGKQALSRIGHLNLTTLRAAESTGSELIRAQRQVEQSDANAGARGTVIRLEERASTIQEVSSVPVSAVTDSVLNNRYSMVNRTDVRASSYTQYPVSGIASETFIPSPFITRGGIARGEIFQGLGGSVGVFRKSPTGEVTSVGTLPRQADNAMRIFRQHLDMPHVRLHSDTSANLTAAKLNAEAFTIGRDVFFASGKLNLSTAGGIALLGHELTHVRQQERGTAGSSTGEISALQHEALESEALANEQTILSLLSVRRPQAPSSPQGDAPIVARKAENSVDAVELTHLSLPQIQSAITESISNPLVAEEGRSVGPITPTESPESTAIEPAAAEPDINRIAEQVYEIIEDRLRREKERRGYF